MKMKNVTFNWTVVGLSAVVVVAKTVAGEAVAAAASDITHD